MLVFFPNAEIPIDSYHTRVNAHKRGINTYYDKVAFDYLRVHGFIKKPQQKPSMLKSAVVISVATVIAVAKYLNLYA